MLKALLNIAFVEQQSIQHASERKIDECFQRYIAAANLPRKKKKAERKAARRDYNFWTSISKHYNSVAALHDHMTNY